MQVVDLEREFYKVFGREAPHPLNLFFAPGRVCIIGEHIDYNGGLVMPAGISLGIYAVVRKLDVNIVWLRSTLFDNDVIVPLDKPIEYDKQHGWANYPLGVIKYLQEAGVQLQGCEILFHSTLPVGAGLSSSASIEVLTGYIFTEAETAQQRIDLALLGRRVENEFIGMNCGIMDQFAVAMAKQNQAMILNCQTLEYTYVPMELKDYSLVILNSMKPHYLVESKYNDRVAECSEALRQLQAVQPIETLAAATVQMIEENITDDVLKRRALHVVHEQARVLEAKALLRDGDIAGVGQLMTASHLSLSHQYEASCVEVDTLFKLITDQAACIGAKITGGGFGGCVIALVQTAHAEEAVSSAMLQYHAQTGLHAEAYPAQISGGVCKFA